MTVTEADVIVWTGALAAFAGTLIASPPRNRIRGQGARQRRGPGSWLGRSLPASSSPRHGGLGAGLTRVRDSYAPELLPPALPRNRPSRSGETVRGRTHWRPSAFQTGPRVRWARPHVGPHAVELR
jgi:hypothetical protein